MKKLLMSLTALTLVAAPMAANAAPNHAPVQTSHNQFDRHDDQQVNRFKANYTRISNPGRYKLKAAPKGYYWARSGNNAVLVSSKTGKVTKSVRNVFGQSQKQVSTQKQNPQPVRR